jgi:capsular polysaccharide biosynthesis protein
MVATRILISNHGGALTNILFMNPSTTVLELRASLDAQNNCYFSLASAVNVNYFYQLCDTAISNEDPHTANLVIDTVELVKTLNKIIDYDG